MAIKDETEFTKLTKFTFLQLGQGGFGTVFMARDKKKNMKVACKLCELGKEWSDARVKDMKNVT